MKNNKSFMYVIMPIYQKAWVDWRLWKLRVFLFLNSLL